MSNYFSTDYQRKIFEDRYAQTKQDGSKETIEETFERISLGSTEVYELLVGKKFIPAGRILSNVGGNGNNMVGNCFYIPILEDSLDGIMKRQADTVKVFAKGGGVGTNFSTLRPKDAPVQGAQTGTSGPCSFIDATEGYSKTIKQGGSRRAATLIAMNCDHPDIFEFVTAKTDHARWSTANVSVGIYDAFMEAVVLDGTWDLKFNGEVYRTIQARDLWKEICRCAWQSAEPGLLFLDTINKGYPVNYKYKIEGTNPCQPRDALLWDVNRLRRIDDSNAVSWTSWKTGVKEVIELTTNTGMKIKVTPEHKLMLEDGSWCEAKDTVGKRLPKTKDLEGLSRRVEFIEGVQEHIDSTQLLRGFLFGDGFLCGGKEGISVKINEDNEPQVAKLLRNFGFTKQESGAFYLNRKWLENSTNEDYSFLEQRVWERELPNDILFGDRVRFTSFLCGLFEANGSCNTSAGQISLKSTCYSTVQNVQVLLGSMGVHSSIASNKPAEIRWANGEYVSKQSYNLQVPASYGMWFGTVIGFLSEYKLKNLRGAQNRAVIKVVKVESLGVQEVWDYRMNTTPHYNFCQGTILANCGEIPLQNYGMCLLGSMILPTFVREGKFDFNAFSVAVRQAVRYLDSLIDITTFPIPEVEEMMLKTRPIGLGATGLADALFLLGIPYGNSKACLKIVSKIAEALYTEARRVSEELAEEKGAFPDYDSSKASYSPRRNSTLISFAPTGTISGLIGCSYGIEPHFAPQVTRNEDLGRDVVGNPIIDKYMQDNKLTTLPDHARFVGGSAEKYSLTVADHLQVLSSLAKWVDNAISKTTNLPQSASIEDVSSVFMYCWEENIKGITVYRDRSREDQPVSWTSTPVVGEDEGEDGDDDYFELVDYVTHPKVRPDDVEGCTYRVKYSPTEPSMKITINDLEEEPLEILFKVDNALHQEYLDGLSRAITSLWRRGIRAEHLFEEYCSYLSPNAGSWYEYPEGKRVYLRSILHAIGLIVKKHFRKLDFESPQVSPLNASLVPEAVNPRGEKCPSCGEFSVFPAEGCRVCESCLWEACG